MQSDPTTQLTSSIAPTAPRHFCILEAKAAAGELRSSLVTAKKSATLSCSGMMRGAPGALGRGSGSAGGRPLRSAPGCRLSPAQRPAPRTGSPVPQREPLRPSLLRPLPPLRRHAAALPVRALKAKSRSAPQEPLP